jgi:hypothetical protein
MLAKAAEANPAIVSKADSIRVREALANILQSAPFRTSHQCQIFLTYIVERTLTGENNMLRERVIGTEVFGRSADYEPGEDPIVRIRAAEVRKRLAQYYQSSGDCLVRIDMPPGSYRAIFQVNAAQVPAAATQIPGKTSHFRLVAFAVLVMASAVAIRFTYSARTSELDQFWAPAFASPKPILIYNATTTVFRPLAPASSDQGLVTVRGQYTCIGDAYASVVLASLFSQKRRLYQMRYGSDLTFGDLRYQPSVLIGAFNNSWTLQTTNELRFVFEKHPTIRDRSEKRLYTPLDLQPDGRTTEDYGIVSRVFDSKTGELLIAAAGITQYGTRAAGEFLTSAQLMKTLAANAPRDWQKKNLQVLLSTKVIEDMPGPPTIVKTYFW